MKQLSKTVLFYCCITQLLAFSSQTEPVPEDLKRLSEDALRLENGDFSSCLKHAEEENVCPPSKYRAPTGDCNNVYHAKWGARGDIFLRLLPPKYSDKKQQAREDLPKPKAIVTQLKQKNSSFGIKKHLSLMFPIWGQLVYEDIAKIYSMDSSVDCCAETNANHSYCYPVKGSGCKPYVRSAITRENGGCTFDHREQMNGASSFLDGSSLYGDTVEQMKSIRAFNKGKVRLDQCAKCKQIPLGLLYKTLFEEHNRVAEELFKMNPLLNDDEIFFETRKIIVAEIQQITFNEFLPLLLGQETAHKFNVTSASGGYYTRYSGQNRPGTYNELATSGFPVFKSLVPVDNINAKTDVSSLISMSPQEKMVDLQGDLLNDWGPLEMAIHRSRDHGISPYTDVVETCREYFDTHAFETSSLWDESGKERDVLNELYRNPKDIDLIVGTMLEKPKIGAVFGPTLTCMFARQFEKLRNSDRFWFENEIPPSSLPLNKLKAIQSVTIAGLLCATKSVETVQPKAFYLQDTYLNTPITCNHVPGLDLALWDKNSQKEEKTDESGIPLADIKDFKERVGDELSEEAIKMALEAAKEKLIERKKKEYELWLLNGGIDARSPDGTAASFSKANRNALLIANSSLFYELASNEIMHVLQGNNRRKRQTFDDFSNNLQFIDVNSFMTGSISPISMEPQCEDFSLPCDTTTPFRSMTGHCNNLKNPTLGQSLTTFARLLPPVYEDGISAPRVTSVTGQGLPNPRTISSSIHPDISNLHTRYSLMVMQFAQFLDHDLTMTPIHKGFHESIPSCRPCNSPQTVHPECNPIPLPPRDHYFPEVNITDGNQFCFPFMRSLPGQQALGPREQINQNSAFLDASQIYGENTCIARKLRGFSGRMNSTIHPTRGKELLPLSPSHPECKAPSGYCFIAGDGRASEQPALTAIHTIFMREHNRIVEGLRGVNPHWNGEQLFEHARRINIAINQHITYNEFLPRILSWNAVNLYGLKLLPQGYYTEYNPSCNPAIVSEFAAAAFRIGHSLLRPHIPRMNSQHQAVDPPLLLRDTFFKVDMILQPGMIDEISRGLVATPMETLDQFITGEVTNHLFEERTIPFSGVDLISLNVQRARDHGIPSYNNYRALCNLKRAQTWDDLSREIPPEVIRRLKEVYSHVDDIDLFPGGLSERPLQGGLVGPTFACIIALQFRQLRKCDRFWYENNDPIVRFTEPQLAEIRKTTLAKVVCENLDEPGEMQRAAFDLPSNFLNPRVPCQSMPQIDLNAWRENVQGCQIGGKSVKVGESAFPTPCTSCICSNEGPQCASLRITDCGQLAREWSREAILKDDICSSQCGQFLSQNTQPAAGSSNIPVNLRPPPLRQSRSRPVSSFDSFAFPDLSSFTSG